MSISIVCFGFDVTGVDIVSGMLERARTKSVGLSTRWIEGDAQLFDLGARFRLIFLTGNAFQAFLTQPDQEALLERARTHLHDDGLFAVETRNPRWSTSEAGHEDRAGLFVNLETRMEEQESPGYIDASGHSVRGSRTQAYDHVAQILHWTTYRRWVEDGMERTTTTRIALRYAFPQELEALLHYNGFTIVRQYGDWNLEPLTAASRSMLVMCRKRK